MRDHPGICGEKPGGSVSSWTRPHNREPSSSISPTLVPLTLSSSIRFTAFPVSCQFAGSGNSAILRNISASRTRVRCPSASISQSYCACFASRPPVFTNLCCRLVRDQSFIALLRFYGNAWLKGHFSKPLCPPVTSLTKSTVSRAHFCCFSFAQAHRLQRIGAAFHASAMSRRSRSCSSTARIYLRRGQAKQASWALRPR